MSVLTLELREVGLFYPSLELLDGYFIIQLSPQENSIVSPVQVPSSAKASSFNHRLESVKLLTASSLD